MLPNRGIEAAGCRVEFAGTSSSRRGDLIARVNRLCHHPRMGELSSVDRAAHSQVLLQFREVMLPPSLPAPRKRRECVRTAAVARVPALASRSAHRM